MAGINLNSIFVLLSEQIKIDYDRMAENIPHHGERGAGRETILKDLLSNYLPERFGIDSGFVIDIQGSKSRQVDLVVYDRFMGPRFKLAGGKYAYPCEIVVAAGEVKTHLDRRELADSVEKLWSVSKLDRSGGGRNRVRNGYHFVQQEHLDPVKNACDAIWTFIFSSSATKMDTLSNTFVEQCRGADRHLWPNLVCVLNAGILSYSTESGLTTDPRGASSVYYTTPDESKYALLKWFMLLNQAVCDCHITAVDTINYLRASQSRNVKVSIP